MSLRAHFDSLSDEELASRIRQGGLTDEALACALAEAAARGLHLAPEPAETSRSDDDEGDMVMVERGLSPQEAQVLAGFLASAGIRVVAGDTHTIQANTLLSIAMGGASLRVPASQVQTARELLKAFRRGDFEIGDDFDAGERAP